MSNIVLMSPLDQVIVTDIWAAVLATGITLASVTHTVPAPLTKVSEATDTTNGISQVKVSGGVHGDLYQCQSAGTLSNGEVINLTYAVRCLNS